MTHICDNRCRGESGHHAWPSPRKDECLCDQRFTLGVEKVWCPLHDGTKEEPIDDKDLLVQLRPLLAALPFADHKRGLEETGEWMRAAGEEIAALRQQRDLLVAAYKTSKARCLVPIGTNTVPLIAAMGEAWRAAEANPELKKILEKP